MIQRYRDVLERAISPRTPLTKEFNGRTTKITDPVDLEFYDLREQTRHLLSAAELHLIKTAQWCRNAVAHRDVIPSEAIERLSDLYVDNFDLLETDIPGWNWPRCGQTLTMTVGPSGAGKSTGRTGRRGRLLGRRTGRTFRGRGSARRQSKVFRHVRMRSTQVLSNGKDVIVDAMHVEAEDRKRQSMIAPPDIGIRYVIIDRPLADKLRDAGWRAGRDIVERYHEAFPTKVLGALNGDGRPDVQILDLRAPGSTNHSGT